jgi:hypothetical protein
MGFARLLNLKTPCNDECILKFRANCKLKKEGKGTLMVVAEIAEMDNGNTMALSLHVFLCLLHSKKNSPQRSARALRIFLFT